MTHSKRFSEKIICKQSDTIFSKGETAAAKNNAGYFIIN